MWIVLLGCHGAGKTSLGKALGDHLGWRFHEEIGRVLAENPRWRAPEITAAEAQQAFDDEVFRRERRRDLTWSPEVPRLIETWHPGNLAYALARGSKISPRHLDHLRTLRQRAQVACLPLLAPREVLQARQSEPGSLPFFLGIAGQAMALAEQLGLRILPPVWTHLAPPETLAVRIAPKLLGLARSSRRPLPNQPIQGALG
jgi:hypothetical protein